MQDAANLAEAKEVLSCSRLYALNLLELMQHSLFAANPNSSDSTSNVITIAGKKFLCF